MGTFWARPAPAGYERSCGSDEEAPSASLDELQEELGELTQEIVLELDKATEFHSDFVVTIKGRQLKPTPRRQLRPTSDYWQHFGTAVNRGLREHFTMTMMVPGKRPGTGNRANLVVHTPVELYWVNRCRWQTSTGFHENPTALVVLQRVPRLDLWLTTEAVSSAPPTPKTPSWWPLRLFVGTTAAPPVEDPPREYLLQELPRDPLPVPYRAFIYTSGSTEFHLLERVVVREWTRPG